MSQQNSEVYPKISGRKHEVLCIGLAPTTDVCLNVWPIGCGTIKRCVLVGVSVSLGQTLMFLLIKLTLI